MLGKKGNSSSQQATTTTQTDTQISPIPTPQPQITQTAEVPDIPGGWKTYKNDAYGFEISYPENYQALYDSENLYGWPDAVVLLYSGGQSYDIPIEVWDSVSEYQSKYPNTENLTVKQVGNKYITLLNMNFGEEVDEIIKTFRLTE